MDRQDKLMNIGVSTLHELRDQAIILSLGCEYLCLEPILTKIGRNIDRNIEKVRGEIASLIKQFPGKFSQETNFEDILTEIQNTAHMLQQPNKELCEEGRINELGRGFEDKAKALAGVVHDIRLKVAGRGPAYSTGDSVLNLFRRFGGTGTPLAGMISWAFKIIVVFVVFLALITAYLFMTMEKESDLRQKIEVSESEMASKRVIIFDLETRRQEIARRIAEIESKELLRQDKITIIDLEVEMRSIDNEIQKLQSEILLNQERINDSKEKIEKMKDQTFWQRLF